MKLSAIELDAAGIENGTWRNAVGLPGIKFKLRGSDNLDWRRLNLKLSASLPAAATFGDVDPADDDRITGELLFSACLLDWSGLDTDEAAPASVAAGDTSESSLMPLAYTKELAKTLLTDPKYRRFRNSVLRTAQLLSVETKAERDAAAKN